MPGYVTTWNSPANNNFEVHCITCHRLPGPENQRYLCHHQNGAFTVTKTGIIDTQTDVYSYCSPDCHGS